LICFQSSFMCLDITFSGSSLMASYIFFVSAFFAAK
jgi:hypothetical protein